MHSCPTAKKQGSLPEWMCWHGYCYGPVSVYHKPVLYQNSWMDPAWFSAPRFPSGYPTLHYTKIQVSPKISVLPSETFPQILDFKKWGYSTSTIVKLLSSVVCCIVRGQVLSTVNWRPSPVDHTQHPASCTAWWVTGHQPINVIITRMLQLQNREYALVTNMPFYCQGTTWFCCGCERCLWQLQQKSHTTSCITAKPAQDSDR